MRRMVISTAVLVGVCAAGSLLRGTELLLFGGGERAMPALLVGAVAAAGFFRLLRRLRAMRGSDAGLAGRGPGGQDG